ncbi:MAG: tail fiber domain-containing protein, partial [Bacteroidales bacterium]|nr:tail fiber domain-containing protein [Bacteroidales bacterium]
LATWQTLPSGLWQANGSNIYYNNGNVGIGTTSPAAKLDVSAPAGPNLIIRDSNGSNDRPGIQFTNNYIHYIAGDDGSEEIFGFYSGFGSVRNYSARLNIHGPAGNDWGKYISLTHDGNHGRISTDAGYLVLQPAGNRVGVGTDAPTQSLDVNGTLRVRGMTTGSSAGTVYRTTDGTLITGASDIRLKENIETLETCLEKVLQLRGVSFNWKNDPGMGTRIGFIAQEFEKVIPELVFTNEVDGYKGINYAEVNAILVEAIKEQQKQIEELKAIVNSLISNQ